MWTNARKWQPAAAPTSEGNDHSGFGRNRIDKKVLTSIRANTHPLRPTHTWHSFSSARESMWFSARLALLCVTLCSLLQTVYGSIESNFTESPTLILVVDPPDGHSSPAALGVFARASDPDAIVYFDTNGNSPTFASDHRTYESPFIQLDTPFQASRNRTIAMIAYLETENEDGTITIVRSKLIRRNYFVEGSARENSFGFLVPGVESGGYFIKFGLEIAAQARAQVAGGQEFANFSSRLGIGTYDVQVAALDLVSLDPDLTGFEGGFPGELPCELFAIFAD